MSSDATRAQEVKTHGEQGSPLLQHRSTSNRGLAGGILFLIVLAAALLGTALLGHAGQASTDPSFGKISNEGLDGPKETPLPGVSTTEGAFESRLPEHAQPERGALGYLRLLEHLPRLSHDG